MPFLEQVYSVLIISSSERFKCSLSSLLPSRDYTPLHMVKSISGAQRSLAERSYDIVILDTPLPDDSGQKFAMDLCAGSSTIAILFTRQDLYAETYEKVMRSGVLVLRKPLSLATLTQAMDWARSIKERLRGYEKKAVSLEEKMSEIRRINRAKWTLIETCSMTEEDAHHYIEKQAMDRCVTKCQIADEILQTYR